MTSINVVWAREPIPAGPSVFLAGPTPRSDSVPSWRPDVVAALEAAWAGTQPLTVLTPESRGGKRAAEYHDQVEWEAAGLDSASAILFWIPRDISTLPGFTTNVEFGLHVRSGKVVLGCPVDCPNPERNRYLIWTAQRYGAPVFDTVSATVDGALALIRMAAAPKPTELDPDAHDSSDSGCDSCGTCMACDGCADPGNPLNEERGDCSACGACGDCVRRCAEQRVLEAAPKPSGVDRG